MRLNTVFTVLVVLVSMFSLQACDKVAAIAAIAGGPADGHDGLWYQAHYAEAKAEVDYCTKKYHGPNSTKEDLAKMPNFCTLAYDATTVHEAPLKGWAYWEALCKIGNPAGRKNSCDFAVRAAKGIDANSKEAQDILAQEIAHLPDALK